MGLNLKRLWKRKWPFCDVAMRGNGGGSGGGGGGRGDWEWFQASGTARIVDCKIDPLTGINIKEIGAMV